MKGKAIIPLVLGLGVGLVAVKVGVDAVRKAKGSPTNQESVKYLAAKIDIGAFQKITPEMVEVRETTDPSMVPVNDRISSLEEIQDRVTAKGIPQKSPVMKSMLAEPGTPQGMVGRIPKGFRAASVKIDEVTGVAYQITPGDWVDVIVVMDVQYTGKGSRKKETIAETILQHVQVAAIGQTTSGQQMGGPEQTKPAKSATLFVREEDVAKLHLAQTRGKITLTMRGDDDTQKTALPAVKDTDVFEALKAAAQLEDELNATQPTQVAATPAPPQPAQPAITPHSVMVFRGSTSPRTPSTAELITFESRDSGHIISITEGPVASRAASLRGETAAPMTRPDNAPAPGGVQPPDFQPPDFDPQDFDPSMEYE